MSQDVPLSRGFVPLSERVVPKKALTAKQRAAIAALLEGQAIQDAAETVNVDRRTLTRWLGEPAFVAELHAGSDAALQTASARLAGKTEAAVSALLNVMDDPAAPGAAVQRLAAEAVINQAVRLRAHTDLAARLAQVEANQEMVEVQNENRN